MTVLKFIFRFVGWTLGILLLVCLVFALAWWARWSLLTTALILCCIALCIFLFFAARKLYIWYNKKRYVRDVLSKDPSKQEQNTPINAMNKAWHEGFNKIFRFGRRSQHLPWAMFLEQDTKDTAQLLRALRNNTQEKLLPQESLLQWYVLPELVVLRPHVKYSQEALLSHENQEEWEDFLVDMVKCRKKKSIDAVILSVPTSLLLGDTMAMQEYGRALRARIHEMESLSKRPILLYILVSGIEKLSGFTSLVAHMSEERRARALGCTFHAQEMLATSAYAQESVAHACMDLRKEIVQQAASNNIMPCGHIYAAPTSLESIQEKLSVFLDCLLLGLSVNKNVFLRGLYYTYALDSLNNNQATKKTIASDIAAPLAQATPIAPLLSTAPEQNSLPTEESTTSPPIDFLSFETPTPVAFTAPTATPSVPSSTPLSQPENPRALGAAFVEELFLGIIPRDAYGTQSTRSSFSLGNLLSPCIVCWFCALFILCGIMAANVMHTHQVFQAVSTKKNLTEHSALHDPHLENMQQRLLIFDKAQKEWWLPSLGFNKLQREREQTAVAYKASMENIVVPAVIKDILTRANASTQNEKAPAYEAARCLLWMQTALLQQSTKGNTDEIRAGIFPAAPRAVSTPTTLAPREKNAAQSTSYKPQAATQSNTPNASQGTSATPAHVWSPVFGELFLSYLEVADPKHLPSLQAQVGDAINAIFDHNGEQLFAYIESSVNTKLAREAVGLSLFWPNIPAGTQGFTSVPPIYTKAGYESLSLQMQALLDNKKLAEQPYWKNYEQRYATAWSDFIVQSDAAWAGITQVSTLYSMGSVKNIFDDPYIRLFYTMSDALSVLDGSTMAPTWLGDVFLVRALLDVTRLSANTKPDSLFAIPSTVADILRTSDVSMHSIRDHVLKTRNMGDLLDAIQSLRNYEADLQGLRATLANEEGCFALAKVEFGGAAFGKPEESQMTQANTMLRSAFDLIQLQFNNQRNSHKDVDWGSNSPVVYVLRGPLRFMAHAIACTAALTIQKQWETDVLAPAALVSENNYLQTIVGEKGLLHAFINEKAVAFLNQTVGKFEPRIWMHVPFPFTQDFLQFAQDGQVAAKHLPKEEYLIGINSQTSDINDEAKERLQYFEISIPSSKGNLELRNNNYPVRKSFTYVTAEPSHVHITLSFPSLKLTYKYDSLIEFLQDFHYGERFFTAKDFPDEAEKMKSLGIDEIVLRILPENIGEILANHDTSLPATPERITKVW